MAFVQSSIPQEEQNQLGPTGQTTPNPLSMLPPQAAQTGGSSGQGGGGIGAGAPSVGTSTQFGSASSRLGDYLKANQDQVQQMANQVAGQMGAQYSGIKSGIDQAGQDFAGQVAAGYTPSDPTLLSQVQANPTAVASNPNSVKAFQAQLNDQYTGPTSFEASAPYANVQKNVQDAVQQSQLLGTYPGLSTYLQNNIENNATPGQNTLDTVLLQGNQPAFQTVQQAAAPFSGLTDYLSGLANTQNQGVQAAQAAAPAARQAAASALGTATGNFNTGINAEESAALNKVKNYNTALQAAQQKTSSGVNLINQLRDIMGQYGASYPAGVNPPWADPNSVTVPNQVAALPSASSVASPKDYETLAALTTLAGGPINSPIDLSTADQAGTFSAPGSIDTSSIQNAYQAMKDFLTGPQGNNITVGSSANLNPFVSAGNQWYQNLVTQLGGYVYPGSGNYPTVFNVTNQSPPNGAGGLGGTGLGGV